MDDAQEILTGKSYLLHKVTIDDDTLRALFAVHAPNARFAYPVNYDDPAGRARIAWDYADACMAERDRRKAGK